MRAKRSLRPSIVLATWPNYSGRMQWSGALRYAAEQTNWDVLSNNMFIGDQAEKQFWESLKRKKVNGIISDSFLFDKVTKAISGRRVPIVRLSDIPQKSQFPSCCIDDAAIGEAAAVTLMRRGFVNFAYLGTRSQFDKPHSELRQSAFALKLRKSGHLALHVLHQDDLLADVLGKLPKPLGIFAYNDQLAQIALNACRSARVPVPEQAGIIGVDNDCSICESLRPPLSSIQPDFEQGGYDAAMLLDRILHGNRTPVTVKFGIANIVERDSTRDLKSGGRLVSSACEILRRRHHERLSPESVAQELGVSVTLLRLRFREILGTGIHDYLSEVRLEHASNLLMTTNRRSFEISGECGFPSNENFHRAFKSHFGMTPMDWRKSRNG